MVIAGFGPPNMGLGLGAWGSVGLVLVGLGRAWGSVGLVGLGRVDVTGEIGQV